MTVAPKRLKDSGGTLAQALADYADAPLPPLPSRSKARAPSWSFGFLAFPVALAAGLALIVSWRSAPPKTSILFAGADARHEAEGPLTAGSGLLIAAYGDDHRLVMLADGSLEREAVDRLRLASGTLAVSTRSSLVVVAGDSAVRLVKGAAEITREPFSVRAFEGALELELPSKVVRLGPGEAWPAGVASAGLARQFLDARTSPLHVEASAPVAIDGVLVGLPPLDVPLAPGRHRASANGVVVEVETPGTRSVEIPSPNTLLESARASDDVDEALRLFAQLSSAPNAELALYERAQRQRRAERLEGALADLVELRARFPAGALAAEASLGRAEVFMALGRDEALAETTDFLERFPESERRAEVLILRAELHRRANRLERAAVDLAAAARDERWADEAHWRACFLAGDQARAATDYLRQHPTGAHAAEARAALGGQK